MFDFFYNSEHKKIILGLAELTAKMDDSMAVDNPFEKMTRSPNHLIAWFLLYAAVEPSKLDILWNNLKALAAKYDVPVIANEDIRILQEILQGIICNKGMLEALNYFADKVRIEVNAEPESFIKIISENGHAVFAESSKQKGMVKRNSGLDEICVISTVEQSVQWHKSLSDEKSGYLSLLQEPLLKGNLKFFFYDPKSGEFRETIEKEEIIRLAVNTFSISGDLQDSEGFNFHIPLSPGQSELQINIPRKKVLRGLYEAFDRTGLGEIDVFIQGKTRLDKEGAFASQTQEATIYRGGPSFLDLTMKQKPSVLFLDAKIAANYEEKPSRLADSPILLIEIKTKSGGTLLLSPVALNSSAALRLIDVATRKHSLRICERLLKAVTGKRAEDGSLYNLDSKEFGLLYDVFLSAKRIVSTQGITFSMSDCQAYKAHYRATTLADLTKELSRLLQVIFSSYLSLGQTAELMQGCTVLQNGYSSMELKLSSFVIDFFLSMNIDLRMPVRFSENISEGRGLASSVYLPSKEMPLKKQDATRELIKEYLTAQILPILKASHDVFKEILYVRMSNFVVKSGEEYYSTVKQDFFFASHSSEALSKLKSFLESCLGLKPELEIMQPEYDRYWGDTSSFKEQYLILNCEDINVFLAHFISMSFLQVLNHALPWFSDFLKYESLRKQIAGVMCDFDTNTSENNCFEYALLHFLGVPIKPAVSQYTFDKETSQFLLKLEISEQECHAVLDAFAKYGHAVKVKKIYLKTGFGIPIQFLLDNWNQIKVFLPEELLVFQREKLFRKEEKERKELIESESLDYRTKKRLWENELDRQEMQIFDQELIEKIFNLNERLIVSMSFDFSLSRMMLNTINNKAAIAIEEIIHLKLASKFNKNYEGLVSLGYPHSKVGINVKALRDLIPLIPSLKSGVEIFDYSDEELLRVQKTFYERKGTVLFFNGFSIDRLGKLFGFKPELIVCFTRSNRDVLIHTVNEADAQLIKMGIESQFKLVQGKLSCGRDSAQTYLKIPSELVEKFQAFLQSTMDRISVKAEDKREEPETCIESLHLASAGGLFSRVPIYTQLLRLASDCSAIREPLEKKQYALALRRACFGSQFDVVKLILQHHDSLRVDINEPSSNGMTALDWLLSTTSVGNEKEEVKRLLLEQGAVGQTTLSFLRAL